MGFMKKGLFGCDLKNQVSVIALTYCAVSVVLITYGFLHCLHPERFAVKDTDNHLDLARERIVNYSAGMENMTENVSDEDEYLDQDIFVDSSDNNYSRELEDIKNQGIEVIVAGIIKLTCSLLLFQGVRSNVQWLLLPWLVEEIVEMVGGIILCFVYTFRAANWSASMTIFGILFYMIIAYFVVSVGSFYVLMKRKNRNADLIVQSVSQVTGGFQTGMNYQRLEEECWQSEPNLASEFTSGKNNTGFTREKKVNMDDENDEHVLYVQ